MDLAQLDFFTPLASQSAALAGYSWDDLLKDPSAVDLLLPGLRPRLKTALASKKYPGPGRIGLAVIPSSAVIVPHLLYWRERWGQGAAAAAPAAVRLSGLLTGVGATTRTECCWIGLPPAAAPEKGLADRGGAEYRRLADRVWSMAQPPPLAFLGIDFRDLAAELDKLPNPFMKKDQRKMMERWKATVNTLALGAGAGAARIDAAGARWVLTVRCE